VLHATSGLAVGLLALLAAAVLVGGEHPAPWLIALLIGAYGVIASIAFPAFLTVAPHVFGATRLGHASAITNVLSMFCHVCGPLTVALMRWHLPWWPVFAVFVVISAFGWACLLAVPLPLAPVASASVAPTAPLARGVWTLCREQRGLVAILLALAVFSILAAGPLEVLAPLFGQLAGGGSALYAGLFVAVGGVGLSVGAILALRVVGRRRVGAWLCGSGVLGTLLMVTMTYAPGGWRFVVFFFGGVLGGVFTSLCLAGIQARAPDADRGRILGLYSLILGGTPALGGYVSGRLVDLVGVVPATRLMFGVAAVGYLLLYLSHADLRDTASAAGNSSDPHTAADAAVNRAAATPAAE
jgi:hypothetical protein